MPPFHWWRTVFFLIPIIGIYTILLGIISMIASVFGSAFFAHRCAQWWGKLIVLTSGVRIERSGVALPPPTEGCIVVANHASIYDIPVLFTAIPRQLRLMAKAALGFVPFIGWHLKLSGHLLVNRKNPGAAIFKKMQRMARSGASLLVFPEGGRSSDGAVKKFKGGVFLLAIETGLPILPVTIVGNRAVMPKGRLMVCPADVRVVVHPLVATSGLTREDARALAAKVQGIVSEGMAPTTMPRA